MRKIVIGSAATVSGLALLLAWQLSTNDTDAAEAAGGETTFVGEAKPTDYGDVQVQITVVDGKITEAKALTYPNTSDVDKKINARAIPVLEEATVGSQSADFELVSGATITSNAYVGSLQDALDQAGL